MESAKDQVLTFLEKCEELKKCKFIMATTKIKDLLKCIVNSPELYSLFDSVTKDFDYLSVKSQCLVTVSDGVYRRNSVMLPQTVGQRLAFIFCLLVDFDRDNINFNDFLRLYFPVDGSYFESYQLFCRTIIDSLEEMIRQVFSDSLESERVQQPVTSQKTELISQISVAVRDEMRFVSESVIPDEEKESGYKMLTELLNAVNSGNANLIEALICGYNYYLLFNKCVGDGVENLIKLLAEYGLLL